jgi:hypothetical protein
MTTPRGALRGAVPSHATPHADALDLEAIDPRRALDALTSTRFERERADANAADLSHLDPRSALDALTSTRFEREHARRGR